jgi:hypothetical protein
MTRLWVRGSLAATVWTTPPSADSMSGPPVDVSDVGSRIQEILADPRYVEQRETLLERLFGPLYDWGERMFAFLYDLVSRLLLRLLSLLDLEVLSWLGPLLVAMVAVAGTLVLGRRRARELERRATIERILELGTDPSELEELAAAAAQQGDHAEFIRLRFVAGLLRLDNAGRIDFYPGLSNSLVSTALGDPTFDRLAEQFDGVVYGRRPATATDADQARNNWNTVLGVRT